MALRRGQNNLFVIGDIRFWWIVDSNLQVKQNVNALRVVGLMGEREGGLCMARGEAEERRRLSFQCS